MARRITKRDKGVRVEFVFGPDINTDEDGQIVISPHRDFEVWVEGKYVSRFDTSSHGLIEYARKMSEVLK